MNASSLFYGTLAITLLCGLIWAMIWGGKVPKAYRERGCMGRKWREQFPSVPKDVIRSFLEVFADAFGFDRKNKLIFNPDDRLLEIYRSVYPDKSSPDGLELETLAITVEEIYSI